MKPLEEERNIDVRVAGLEKDVTRMDDRISSHGREIDQLTSVVTELQVRAATRDETMSRIEGKVDTLCARPAESWEKLKWLVLGGAIGVLVNFIFATAGIN